MSFDPNKLEIRLIKRNLPGDPGDSSYEISIALIYEGYEISNDSITIEETK